MNEIKSFAYKIQNSNQKLIKNEKEINELFYLGSIPDQLLIRTGGYQNLSNFIMHNNLYRTFFTKTLWPDFSENSNQLLSLL